MLIKACVFILCLGIVVIIGGLAMLCCMNKEEAGAKTMLAGFLLSSLGAVCLLFRKVGVAHIKKVKKISEKRKEKEL